MFVQLILKIFQAISLQKQTVALFFFLKEVGKQRRLDVFCCHLLKWSVAWDAIHILHSKKKKNKQK